MDKRRATVVWKNVAMLFFFVLLNLLSIFRFGNSVGLYADAVMPDYLAVKLANSNTLTGSMALPYVGMPLLGQAYHGTITMFVSYIALLITGTTSVLQLRITNGIYAALIAFVMYRILRRQNVHFRIAFIASTLMLLSPNVVGTFFTQYYIELPGVVFLFLIIYALLKWNDNEDNYALLLRAGVYGGLAIYDYFNFIFVFPAAVGVVLVISNNRKKERVFENTLIISVGYVIGCLPYIIGYCGLILSLLADMESKYKEIILVLITLLVLGVLVLIYKLQKTVSKKNRIISSSLLAAGIAFCFLIVFFVLDRYQSYFLGLNVAGSSGGLITRIQLIGEYLIDVLCHSAIEYLVIGKKLSYGLWIVPVIVLVLSVIAIYLNKKDGGKEHKNQVEMILAILVGAILYLLCCITMATRMQGQHFVCLMFLIYLVGGLSASVVLNYAVSNFEQKIVIKSGTYIVSIVLAFLLLANNTTIAWRLNNSISTENTYNKYYSNAIQNLAEEAIESRDNGETEYYIFPEWGIMTSFDYLTKNAIGFSGDIDASALSRIQSEFCSDIVLCYWEDDNQDDYIANLQLAFPDKEIVSGEVQGNYAPIKTLRVNAE